MKSKEEAVFLEFLKELIKEYNKQTRLKGD